MAQPAAPRRIAGTCSCSECQGWARTVRILDQDARVLEHLAARALFEGRAGRAAHLHARIADLAAAAAILRERLQTGAVHGRGPG